MSFAAPQTRVLADAVPSAWVRNVVLVLGATALTALGAQLAVYLPWNPAVPLTFQTFAVVLSAAVLGPWRGAAAMALYALLGSIGLPIYSAGKSGFGGPSFGYIVGFIVAAIVVGRIAEHGATRSYWRSVGLMLLGNVIIYAIGAAWLKHALDIPWLGVESAFAYGVRDFIVGDIIKIAIAAGILPLAWLGLRKSGLID